MIYLVILKLIFTKTGSKMLVGLLIQTLKKKIVSEAKSEGVKNYLLATSEFGKYMQEDINMYVTRDKLNEAGFFANSIQLLKPWAKLA